MSPDVGGSELLAGRYRLGALLGQGGMAGVFDGYDTRLARPVAVKLLRPEIGAQPAMRQRFEQEARSAAGLSHPNVVSVFDSGEDRGQAFLIMERLPGRTLADAIAEGQMDQRYVTTIIGDVVGALVAAHGIGMVHRDIKPGNILLTDDGRAKVADFGIAKSLEPTSSDDRPDLTMVGLVIGTPAYLAPERLSGAAATPQSDIYAVGVVMYEALSGRKPAEGANLADVARARQTPPPDIAALRPDIAGWLAAVVRRAMAAAPEGRYRSATDMLNDLRAGGSGRRLPPPPVALSPGAAAAIIPAAPGGDLRDGGGTQLMPAGAGPGGSGATPPTQVERPVAAYPPILPGPQGPPSRRGSRRGWVGALVALLVVVIAAVVAIVVVSQHNNSTSSSTSSSTTTDTVTQQLDQVATQLNADGGIGPQAAAVLLRGVAALPPGAGRTEAANRAAAQMQRLLSAGEISETQYNQAIAVLDSAGASPTTTTTSSSTSTSTTSTSTTTTTTPSTTTTVTTTTTMPATTTTTTMPITTTTPASTTTTTTARPSTTTTAPAQGQGQ